MTQRSSCGGSRADGLYRVGMPEPRPDIDKARGRMRRRSHVKRELADLPDRVLPAETVVCLATGTYRMRVGLLVLTDRRILWSLIGPLRLYIEFEEMPLERIASVQWESGTFGGVITIVTGAGQMAIMGVENTDGERIADHAAALLASADTSRDDAAAGSAAVISQLRQLGELRGAGVLTAAEFEAKKAQLLDRI